MEKKYCINCKKEIDNKSNKKFCSKICNSRYNSKKYYEEHKHNKEFKERRKNTFKRWIQKNKERYNKSNLKANRKYQRKKYILIKKNRLCIYCKKKLTTETTMYHKDCYKSKYKKNKEKLILKIQKRIQ